MKLENIKQKYSLKISSPVRDSLSETKKLATNFGSVMQMVTHIDSGETFKPHSRSFIKTQIYYFGFFHALPVEINSSTICLFTVLSVCSDPSTVLIEKLPCERNTTSSSRV